jgi:hypothetical protein
LNCARICDRGGAEDVKNHPWFANIDWNRLKTKQLKPPIAPEVLHAGDIGTDLHICMICLLFFDGFVWVF